MLRVAEVKVSATVDFRAMAEPQKDGPVIHGFQANSETRLLCETSDQGPRPYIPHDLVYRGIRKVNRLVPEKYFLLSMNEDIN